MDTKWIATSLTAWGSVVLFVSGVAPSLNGMLDFFNMGISIEPEWIRSMDEAVKQVIMGVGSAVGLVLVFWGRLRASKALTWLPKLR